MNLMKDSFDWSWFILMWVLFLILPTKDYLKSLKNTTNFQGKKVRLVAVVNGVGYVAPAWKLHFYYACLCLIMIFATIFEFLLHVNVPALSQILGVS